MKKKILNTFMITTFFSLLVINLSFKDGVFNYFNNVSANITEEATCYSTTQDCSWWTSCWDVWKCGICQERESRTRDDSGTCSFN